MPLELVRERLGFAAGGAAGGCAAAAAVVVGLEEEDEVVDPGCRVHPAAAGEPAPAGEVAPQLEHEDPEWRAGGGLPEVSGGESGEHAVEVDA